MTALYTQTKVTWRASSVSITRARMLTKKHITNTRTVLRFRLESKYASSARGRTRNTQIPTSNRTPTTQERTASS